MSDNELGALLRAHRESVTPAEVGLPDGPRRRTPGLRRAELATLAGISVDYLIRLEQGRDRHPSAQVIGALAEAMRLAMDERWLLHTAAKGTSGGLCPEAPAPASSVRPTVQALLDRLEPSPAVLLNRLSDVLAYTTGYQQLTGPVGILDSEPANLVRFVFTDGRARAAYPEWEHVADEQVANLKMASSGDDPHVTGLADELTVTAGSSFSDRLRAPARVPKRTGVERLAHPDVGELRLAYEVLELPDADTQRLVAYLPADEATSAAMDRLARRQPGALRAVTG
ncbi:MAG: helix-turn-helix domain-containing protein [Pseudonocardiaceae bacterium]|nr:helix-turn-helix domain-containing protein [Pseudonocardiaceae bacterium]